MNQRSDSTQDLPARSIAAAIDRTNARKINNLEILCQEKRELVQGGESFPPARWKEWGTGALVRRGVGRMGETPTKKLVDYFCPSALVLRVICPPFAALVINFVRSQKLGDSLKIEESPLQLFLFTERIL